jgi:iduronate 2-sulfatase
LAVRSFVAMNAHVQQTLCSPRRASFLTGQRPETTRVYARAQNYRTLGGNFTSLPRAVATSKWLPRQVLVLQQRRT